MTEAAADWLKRFSFALSAFGVDPAKVRLRAVLHDSIEVECDEVDQRLVSLAIKLCEPKHHLDWKWITFSTRYGLSVAELRTVAGITEEKRQELQLLLNRLKGGTVE
jgi:hypothetical protein